MTDTLPQVVSSIVEELSFEERKRLHYLCGELQPDRCVEDIRALLLSLVSSRLVDPSFLKELMFRMQRYDILRKVLGTSREEVERMLVRGRVVSEYRMLMVNISEQMRRDDFLSLKFLLSGTVPQGIVETATTFLDLVVELEKLCLVSSEKLDMLESWLAMIGRKDLARKVLLFSGRASAANAPQPIQREEQVCSRERPRLVQEHSQCVKLMPAHKACTPRLEALNIKENLKTSIPETPKQSCMYRIQAEPVGTCMIIDCVGADGDMLEQTFRRLHFRVLHLRWPNLGQLRSALWKERHKSRELHESDVFACCIISRAARGELLATEENGPGLALEEVRSLFCGKACPELAGKPKLFFVQSYEVPEAAIGGTYEELETDGPVEALCVESVPSEGDFMWSHCVTAAQHLQRSRHKSVYLQTLCGRLVQGQRRKKTLLDIHTEVNAVVYDHNRRNQSETYSLDLRNTLRKTLVLP